MIKRYCRWVLLSGVFALAGCSAGAQGQDEAVGSTDQALSSPCDVGLAYSGGTWREAGFAAGCIATTTFSFGASSDSPLLFGRSIATYGTTATGDRLGRFFIDRDGSRTWNAGDTNTRFMSSPQTGDQPFVMNLVTKHLSGGSCVATSSGGLLISQPVVGIKRGSSWFIDGNGDGVWEGTSACDLSGTFGDPGDVPTPIGATIGSSRPSGASLAWFFDTDGSLTWSGAPPDTALTAFGTNTMRAFSDGSSQHIGAQNGVDVYLDKNGNEIFDGAPTDIVAPGYLLTTAWTFAGWYTLQPPPS
jgi:hypothetical protein